MPNDMEPQGKRVEVDTFVALSKGQPQKVAHYRRCFGYIEKWVGKPLPEATTAELVKLKERIRAKRSGWEFAKLLRPYYRACDRPDLVEVFGMKATNRKLTKSDILTPAEVGRLLVAAGSRRDAAFFGALFETGVRVGELCAVNVADAEPGEEDGRQVYHFTFRKVKERGQERDGLVVDTFPLMEAWLRAHPDPCPEAELGPWRGPPRQGRGTPSGHRGRGRLEGLPPRSPHGFQGGV